jgi:hypothetical protein
VIASPFTVRTLGLLCGSLLLFAISLHAQGGPPLLTDDPGTPGNGNWEINLAVTDDSFHGQHTLEVPVVDINYGVGDRLQLKYEVPWLLQTGNGPTSTEAGDSIMGVKWRFFDQAKRGVDVSTYPQLSFNSPGPHRISDREVDFLLPLEIVRTQGKTQFNWEIGYNIRQHAMDEMLAGFALGYQLSKTTQALAEVHAISPRDFSASEFLFQLGLRRDLNSRYTILFAIGRGLPGSIDYQPGITGYLGLQLHFGKEKKD